ncbi:MAG: hypothetical protein AB7O62_09325 [Pirellulales bacterium]
MAKSEFFALLPRLVELVPNHESDITISMHNGRVAAFSQDGLFRLLFDPGDEKPPVVHKPHWNDATQERLAVFIRDQLTAPLRDEIGQFGQLKVIFEADFTEFRLEKRWRSLPQK